MARIKSTNFYQKSGKVANEVFSNLGNGEVGCRAKNSKQAPLNEEQKINASGFSALNAEVRYLNPVQTIEIIGKQKNLSTLLSTTCIFLIFSIFAIFCPFSVIQYTFSTL